MSDNNTTSINEKAVILFEMLDIDSSKTLEKRERRQMQNLNERLKRKIWKLRQRDRHLENLKKKLALKMLNY